MPVSAGLRLDAQLYSYLPKTSALICIPYVAGQHHQSLVSLLGGDLAPTAESTGLKSVSGLSQLSTLRLPVPQSVLVVGLNDHVGASPSRSSRVAFCWWRCLRVPLARLIVYLICRQLCIPFLPLIRWYGTSSAPSTWTWTYMGYELNLRK